MSILPLLRATGLALALFVSSVPAAVPNSYTGEAPVNSQSDAERSEALKTALANVVIAQTGESGALARPDVARAVGQAERFVLQYQYRHNPGNGDDGGAKMTLVAQFDSAAVDQMLRKLGLGMASEDSAAASEAPSQATVWIGGIRNADDYARVMGYLGKSNFVRSAQPTQARGDGILVKLSLATDLPRFVDALAIERTLVVASAAVHADGVDASFTLAQ